MPTASSMVTCAVKRLSPCPLPCARRVKSAATGIQHITSTRTVWSGQPLHQKHAQRAGRRCRNAGEQSDSPFYFSRLSILIHRQHRAHGGRQLVGAGGPCWQAARQDSKPAARSVPRPRPRHPQSPPAAPAGIRSETCRRSKAPRSGLLSLWQIEQRKHAWNAHGH